MTPEAAILAALNERAADMEICLGTPPLVFREIPGERPDEYVMVDHLPNTSTRPMVDRTAQDLLGIYQLTLMRRAGEYEITYREQAGQIAEHFLALPRPSADGFEVTVTSVSLGQGRPDGQTHWAIPVSVNYRLDA